LTNRNVSQNSDKNTSRIILNPKMIVFNDGMIPAVTDPLCQTLSEVLRKKPGR
jgi:hypothetical protein